MSTASNQQHQQQQRQRSSVHGRSVLDYENEQDLLRALTVVNLKDDGEENRRGDIGSSDAAAAAAAAASDWRLPVPDPEAAEETLDGELKRLLTLKSYLLLDTEKEEAFDKLTREACHIFGVPTSLISLIDLGRQFLFSNTGNPGNVRETPRSVAFCSHTILNKKGICVVKDTKCDARFQSSPLVTQAPHLRFYAGAPLISPEGYKLGTFCVEGPEPRPAGLSEAEKQLLKDYAAKAMELMVERRQNLRDRLAKCSSQSDIEQRQHPAENPASQGAVGGATSTSTTTAPELRRHAGVTTNLGGILYTHGMCVTAMRLFQESVQTLMFIDELADGGQSVPSTERRQEMAQLLALLQVESLPDASRQGLLEKVGSLYQRCSHTAAASSSDDCHHECEIPGIPGLFHITTSKLKGVADRQTQSGLIFGEAFKINMDGSYHNNGSTAPVASTPVVVDDRRFIIPLDQCSKATLFNMGLIHYHWGAQDTALQFFDLSASLSSQFGSDPLAFDPVVLGCLNNMAHIHLQYGRPKDAMEMLQDALARGNAALTAIYKRCSSTNNSSSATGGQEGGLVNLNRPITTTTTTTPSSSSPLAGPSSSAATAVSSSSPDQVSSPSSSSSLPEPELRRARRLRRKLARTMMNMGHVLFFNCDYDASMRTCQEALELLSVEQQQQPALQPGRQDSEVAALWYNMSVLYYHQGEKVQATTYLDKYLEQASTVSSPTSQPVSTMTSSKHGSEVASSTSSSSSSSLRPSYVQVAEALYRKGKIMFEMGNLYECMKPLNEALRIQRLHHHGRGATGLSSSSGVTTETLCLIGKVYLAREEYDFALNALKQCLDLQRQQQWSSSSDEDKNSNGASFQVAQTLLEVGRAYHGTGDLRASLTVYLEVADLVRNYFGSRHAFVARIDAILGNLYLESGQIDESLTAFAEATKIRVEQGLPVDMNMLQVDQHQLVLAAAATATAGTEGGTRHSRKLDSVAPTA